MLLFLIFASILWLDRSRIVDEQIRPQECGRVRFPNSWWPAKCDGDMTLESGEVVRVVGIENITLIVAASFVMNSES